MQAKRIKIRWLSSLLLLLLASDVCIAPASAQPSPPKRVQASQASIVRFEVHTTHDKYTNPHSEIYLRVGKRRVLVSREPLQFSMLVGQDFKERAIPPRALAACSGWWAGSGVDLYVVRDGKQYVVYQRDLDEQADTTPYKKVKSIPTL